MYDLMYLPFSLFLVVCVCAVLNVLSSPLPPPPNHHHHPLTPVPLMMMLSDCCCWLWWEGKLRGSRLLLETHTHTDDHFSAASSSATKQANTSKQAPLSNHIRMFCRTTVVATPPPPPPPSFALKMAFLRFTGGACTHTPVQQNTVANGRWGAETTNSKLKRWTSD